MIVVFRGDNIPSIQYRVANFLGTLETYEIEHYKEEPKLEIEEYFEVVVSIPIIKEWKNVRYYLDKARSYFEGRKFLTYEEAYNAASSYFTEDDTISKGIRFSIYKRFGVSK